MFACAAGHAQHGARVGCHGAGVVNISEGVTGPTVRSSSCSGSSLARSTGGPPHGWAIGIAQYAGRIKRDVDRYINGVLHYKPRHCFCRSSQCGWIRQLAIGPHCGHWVTQCIHAVLISAYDKVLGKYQANWLMPHPQRAFRGAINKGQVLHLPSKRMLINHSAASAHNVVLDPANIRLALQCVKVTSNHRVNASLLKERLHPIIPLDRGVPPHGSVHEEEDRLIALGCRLQRARKPCNLRITKAHLGIA